MEDFLPAAESQFFVPLSQYHNEISANREQILLCLTPIIPACFSNSPDKFRQ
jgi:hypothetical protein